jgi:uncharacterized protein Yka (UPF0111/DUF47 family)
LKNLKGIFLVGEKTIFDELIQIIVIAENVNELAKKMFLKGYNDKSLNENLHSVRLREKEADSIALKLNEDITSGAVSANVIGNLIECTHKADDIVDLLYYFCRDIARMSKANRPDFSINHENEWIQIFENLFTLSTKSLSKLKQALSSASVPEILQLRKEIEALEEEGDDINDFGFDKLYSSAPKFHFLQFYHYSGLMKKLDFVLDTCEDLSDLIVTVITSVLK